MPDKSKAKVFLRMVAGREERYVICRTLLSYRRHPEPGFSRVKDLA